MKKSISPYTLFWAFSLLILSSCSQKLKLVTGSYSDTGETGINIFDFNLSNGSLNIAGSFNAGPNPSFLCININAGFIYAINEVDSFLNPHSGGLTTIQYRGSFTKLQKTGEMAVPNGGPCYICESPQNDYLLIANYGGGSVAVVKLNEKGIPSSVTDTVHFKGKEGEVSHAHMVSFDPSGEKVIVTDLGLDRIWILRLDRSSGKLSFVLPGGISLPAGTGPRHFTFNNQGSVLYVIGELNSTITVLKADEEKGFLPVQTISTLKEGDTVRNACADIHLSKSGRYLYGSNRGENNIVIYYVNSDGLLKLAGYSDCGGNWPRNFTIDPSGKFLLVGNQKSDNISIFKIDPETGIPVKKINDTKVKAPVCLRF